MPEMRNPYEHEKDRTVYEIGRGAAWLVCLLFMALLWLPMIVEHVQKASQGKWDESPIGKLLSWRPGQGSLVDHLHKVESDLDRSGYSTEIRQRSQQWLTENTGEGNARVFMGYDGWLFYQPDLKALTGYGPMNPEPFSVMKDPELAKLPETRDVVAGFAAQLKERGISLLLIPLPLKPMIYPEAITGRAENGPLTHPDAPAFYQWLRDHDVDVLDLTADVAKVRGERKYIFRREPLKRDREVEASEDERMKKTKDVFLQQDTHWTPESMRHVAERVAAYVKEKYPQAIGTESPAAPIRAVDGVTRSSMGDLVKLLDFKHPHEVFQPESVFLRVVGEGTRSTTSPIVLLGDSFTNVFNDPTIGFGVPDKDEDKQPPIRAGFAENLSLLLNRPLDVISMNGKGSTGVRVEFAKRHDDEVRSKKLVIWAIAARDLLLSRTAAHAWNIDWAPVTFNPNKSKASTSGTENSNGPETKAGEVVIEGKLVEKSKNQSLDTPYRNAVHTALYDVEKVESGKLEAKQVLGVQWTYQDKKMSPFSSFAVGSRYRLTLVPWESRPDLHQINLQDDSTVFDAERWFVVKAEEIK